MVNFYTYTVLAFTPSKLLIVNQPIKSGINKLMVNYPNQDNLLILKQNHSKFYSITKFKTNFFYSGTRNLSHRFRA